MAKSLSQDLRSRLISAVAGGMSRRAAAERFGVSAASAVRWVRAWHETGRRVAKRQGGDRRSDRIEVHHSVILDAIKARADITLDEIAEMLRRDRGTSFASSTVWRFLDRHAMTLKKNGARSRAGQARRRRAAQALVGRPA
jgi:transposase